MRGSPAALERLTEQFARLPGVGMKSAQRLAFHVLEMPLEGAEAFAEAIVDARRSIHPCPVCQNLTDQETCPICADPERDAQRASVSSVLHGRCSGLWPVNAQTIRSAPQYRMIMI